MMKADGRVRGVGEALKRGHWGPRADNNVEKGIVKGKIVYLYVQDTLKTVLD